MSTLYSHRLIKYLDLLAVGILHFLILAPSTANMLLTVLDEEKHHKRVTERTFAWRTLLVGFNLALLINVSLMLDVIIDSLLILFLLSNEPMQYPRLISKVGKIWIGGYTLALITGFTLWLSGKNIWIPGISATLAEFYLGFVKDEEGNSAHSAEDYKTIGMFLSVCNWIIMTLLLMHLKFSNVEITLQQFRNTMQARPVNDHSSTPPSYESVAGREDVESPPPCYEDAVKIERLANIYGEENFQSSNLNA